MNRIRSAARLASTLNLRLTLASRCVQYIKHVRIVMLVSYDHVP